MFIDYCENTMIIKSLTYMNSNLRHPYLKWIIILCSRGCLDIMFIIGLITYEFA